MIDILTAAFFERAILAGLGVALIAGPIGCFIVWRRMAYFGESLAHSGLFGVGLGMLIGFSLTLGAIATAVLLAVLLLLLEQQRQLATDTLLGILSHVSLALGLVTVGLKTGASTETMEFLFGDVLTVRWRDVYMIWGGAVVAIGVLAWMWRDLIAISVHEELARAEGVQVARVEFTFVILIALVIAVAMKIVGLLLITAMLVIPAAAARRFSRTPERMAVFASLLAAGAVILGLLLSAILGVTSGPAIVLAAGILFVLTLAVPQRI
jgi:zinc transport system permease protein